MRARMELTIATPDGAVAARRHARNSVMRAGAELVAQLFAGAGGPITHMGVGISDADESPAFDTKALSNEGADALTGDTRAAIPSSAFTVTLDETRRVALVRVRATLPAAAAVGTVREAGLLSVPETGEPVLYNRVTFAPVSKASDHELTMFWEVSFPWGDLQWLL